MIIRIFNIFFLAARFLLNYLYFFFSNLFRWLSDLIMHVGILTRFAATNIKAAEHSSKNNDFSIFNVNESDKINFCVGKKLMQKNDMMTLLFVTFSRFNRRNYSKVSQLLYNSQTNILTLSDLRKFSYEKSSLTSEEERAINFQGGMYFEVNPLSIFFIFLYGFFEFLLFLFLLFKLGQFLDFSLLDFILHLNENFLIYHSIASVHYTGFGLVTFFYFILGSTVITFWIWMTDLLDEEYSEFATLPQSSWFLESFLIPLSLLATIILSIASILLSFNDVLLIYGYCVPPIIDQFKHLWVFLSTFFNRITNYVIIFDFNVMRDVFFLTEPKFLHILNADPVTLIQGSFGRSSIYYTASSNNPFTLVDKYLGNFTNRFLNDTVSKSNFYKNQSFQHESLKHELLQDIRKLNYLTTIENDLSLQKKYFTAVTNKFNTEFVNFFEFEKDRRTFSGLKRNVSSLLTSKKFRNYEAANYSFQYGVLQPSKSYKFGYFGSFKPTSKQVVGDHDLFDVVAARKNASRFVPHRYPDSYKRHMLSDHPPGLGRKRTRRRRRLLGVGKRFSKMLKTLVPSQPAQSKMLMKRFKKRYTGLLPHQHKQLSKNVSTLPNTSIQRTLHSDPTRFDFSAPHKYNFNRRERGFDTTPISAISRRKHRSILKNVGFTSRFNKGRARKMVNYDRITRMSPYKTYKIQPILPENKGGLQKFRIKTTSYSHNSFNGKRLNLGVLVSRQRELDNLAHANIAYAYLSKNANELVSSRHKEYSVWSKVFRSSLKAMAERTADVKLLEALHFVKKKSKWLTRVDARKLNFERIRDRKLERKVTDHRGLWWYGIRSNPKKRIEQRVEKASQLKEARKEVLSELKEKKLSDAANSPLTEKDKLLLVDRFARYGNIRLFRLLENRFYFDAIKHYDKTGALTKTVKKMGDEGALYPVDTSNQYEKKKIRFSVRRKRRKLRRKVARKIFDYVLRQSRRVIYPMANPISDGTADELTKQSSHANSFLLSYEAIRDSFNSKTFEFDVATVFDGVLYPLLYSPVDSSQHPNTKRFSRHLPKILSLVNQKKSVETVSKSMRDLNGRGMLSNKQGMIIGRRELNSKISSLSSNGREVTFKADDVEITFFKKKKHVAKKYDKIWRQLFTYRRRPFSFHHTSVASLMDIVGHLRTRAKKASKYQPSVDRLLPLRSKRLIAAGFKPLVHARKAFYKSQLSILGDDPLSIAPKIAEIQNKFVNEETARISKIKSEGGYSYEKKYNRLLLQPGLLEPRIEQSEFEKNLEERESMLDKLVFRHKAYVKELASLREREKEFSLSKEQLEYERKLQQKRGQTVPSDKISKVDVLADIARVTKLVERTAAVIRALESSIAESRAKFQKSKMLFVQKNKTKRKPENLEDGLVLISQISEMMEMRGEIITKLEAELSVLEGQFKGAVESPELKHKINVLRKEIEKTNSFLARDLANYQKVVKAYPEIRRVAKDREEEILSSTTTRPTLKQPETTSHNNAKKMSNKASERGVSNVSSKVKNAGNDSKVTSVSKSIDDPVKFTRVLDGSVGDYNTGVFGSKKQAKKSVQFLKPKFFGNGDLPTRSKKDNLETNYVSDLLKNEFDEVDDSTTKNTGRTAPFFKLNSLENPPLWHPFNFDDNSLRYSIKRETITNRVSLDSKIVTVGNTLFWETDWLEKRIAFMQGLRSLNFHRPFDLLLMLENQFHTFSENTIKKYPTKKKYLQDLSKINFKLDFSSDEEGVSTRRNKLVQRFRSNKFRNNPLFSDGEDDGLNIKISRKEKLVSLKEKFLKAVTAKQKKFVEARSLILGGKKKRRYNPRRLNWVDVYGQLLKNSAKEEKKDSKGRVGFKSETKPSLLKHKKNETESSKNKINEDIFEKKVVKGDENDGSNKNNRYKLKSTGRTKKSAFYYKLKQKRKPSFLKLMKVTKRQVLRRLRSEVKVMKAYVDRSYYLRDVLGSRPIPKVWFLNEVSANMVNRSRFRAKSIRRILKDIAVKVAVKMPQTYYSIGSWRILNFNDPRNRLPVGSLSKMYKQVRLYDRSQTWGGYMPAWGIFTKRYRIEPNSLLQSAHPKKILFSSKLGKVKSNDFADFKTFDIPIFLNQEIRDRYHVYMQKFHHLLNFYRSGDKTNNLQRFFYGSILSESLYNSGEFFHLTKNTNFNATKNFRILDSDVSVDLFFLAKKNKSTGYLGDNFDVSLTEERAGLRNAVLTNNVAKRFAIEKINPTWKSLHHGKGIFNKSKIFFAVSLRKKPKLGRVFPVPNRAKLAFISGWKFFPQPPKQARLTINQAADFLHTTSQAAFVEDALLTKPQIKFHFELGDRKRVQGAVQSNPMRHKIKKFKNSVLKVAKSIFINKKFKDKAWLIDSSMTSNFDHVYSIPFARDTQFVKEFRFGQRGLITRSSRLKVYRSFTLGDPLKLKNQTLKTDKKLASHVKSNWRPKTVQEAKDFGVEVVLFDQFFHNLFYKKTSLKKRGGAHFFKSSFKPNLFKNREIPKELTSAPPSQRVRLSYNRNSLQQSSFRPVESKFRIFENSIFGPFYIAKKMDDIFKRLNYASSFYSSFLVNEMKTSLNKTLRLSYLTNKKLTKRLSHPKTPVKHSWLSNVLINLKTRRADINKRYVFPSNIFNLRNFRYIYGDRMLDSTRFSVTKRKFSTQKSFYNNDKLAIIPSNRRNYLFSKYDLDELLKNNEKESIKKINSLMQARSGKFIINPLLVANPALKLKEYANVVQSSQEFEFIQTILSNFINKKHKIQKASDLSFKGRKSKGINSNWYKHSYFNLEPTTYVVNKNIHHNLSSIYSDWVVKQREWFGVYKTHSRMMNRPDRYNIINERWYDLRNWQAAKPWLPVSSFLNNELVFPVSLNSQASLSKKEFVDDLFSYDERSWEQYFTSFMSLPVKRLGGEELVSIVRDDGTYPRTAYDYITNTNELVHDFLVRRRSKPFEKKFRKYRLHKIVKRHKKSNTKTSNAFSQTGLKRGRKFFNYTHAFGLKKTKPTQILKTFSKFLKFLSAEGYSYDRFHFRNYFRVFKYVFTDFIGRNVLNHANIYYSGLDNLKYYSNYMDEEIKISYLSDFQNVVWNKYLHKFFNKTLVVAGHQARLKELRFATQRKVDLPDQLILMPDASQEVPRHVQPLFYLDWRSIKDLWLEYPKQQYRSNLRKLWRYGLKFDLSKNRFNRFILKTMLKDAQSCLIFDRKQRAVFAYLDVLINQKLSSILIQHDFNQRYMNLFKATKNRKLGSFKQVHLDPILKDYMTKKTLVKHIMTTRTQNIASSLNIFSLMNEHYNALAWFEENMFAALTANHIRGVKYRIKKLQAKYFVRLVTINRAKLFYNKSTKTYDSEFYLPKFYYTRIFNSFSDLLLFSISSFFFNKEYFWFQNYNLLSQINTSRKLVLNFRNNYVGELTKLVGFVKNFSLPYIIFFDELWTVFLSKHQTPVMLRRMMFTSDDECRELWLENGFPYRQKWVLAGFRAGFYFETFILECLGINPFDSSITEHFNYDPINNPIFIDKSFWLAWFLIGFLFNFNANYKSYSIEKFSNLFCFDQFFSTSTDLYSHNTHFSYFNYPTLLNNNVGWQKLTERFRKQRPFIQKIETSPLSNTIFGDYNVTMLYSFFMSDLAEFFDLRPVKQQTQYTFNLLLVMLSNFEVFLRIFKISNFAFWGEYFKLSTPPPLSKTVINSELEFLNDDDDVFYAKLDNKSGLIGLDFGLKKSTYLMLQHPNLDQNFFVSSDKWQHFESSFPFYFSNILSKLEFNNLFFDFSSNAYVSSHTIVPYITKNDCILVKHLLSSSHFNSSNEELSNVIKRFVYRTKRPYMRSSHMSSFVRFKNKKLGYAVNVLDSRTFDTSSYLEFDSSLSSLMRPKSYPPVAQSYMKDFDRMSLTFKNNFFNQWHISKLRYLISKRRGHNVSLLPTRVFPAKAQYDFSTVTVQTFKRRVRPTTIFEDLTNDYTSSVVLYQHNPIPFDTHHKRPRVHFQPEYFFERKKGTLNRFIKNISKSHWLLPVLTFKKLQLKIYSELAFSSPLKSDKRIYFAELNPKIVFSRHFSKKRRNLKYLANFKQSRLNFNRLRLKNKRFLAKNLLFLKPISFSDLLTSDLKLRHAFFILRNFQQKLKHFGYFQQTRLRHTTSSSALRRFLYKSSTYRRSVTLNLVHRMRFGLANILNDRIFGKEISNDRFLLKRLFGLSLKGCDRYIFFQNSTVEYPFSSFTPLSIFNPRFKRNVNNKVFFSSSALTSNKQKFESFSTNLFFTRSEDLSEHFRASIKLKLPFFFDFFKNDYASGIFGYGYRWLADDAWVTKRFKKYGFRVFKTFRTYDDKYDVFSKAYPFHSRLNILNRDTRSRYVKKDGLARTAFDVPFRKYEFFNIFKDRASYINSLFAINPRPNVTFSRSSTTSGMVPSFQHRALDSSFLRQKDWILPALKVRPSPKFLILRNNQIRFNKLLVYYSFFKNLSLPLTKKSTFYFWCSFLSFDRRSFILFNRAHNLLSEVDFSNSFVDTENGKFLQIKPASPFKIILPSDANDDAFFYRRLHVLSSASRVALTSPISYLLKPSSRSRWFYSPSSSTFNELAIKRSNNVDFYKFNNFKQIRLYVHYLFNRYKMLGTDSAVRSFKYDLRLQKHTSNVGFLNNYGLSQKDYFFVLSPAIISNSFIGSNFDLRGHRFTNSNLDGFFKVYLNKQIGSANSELTSRGRYKSLGHLLLFSESKTNHTSFYTPQEYVEYKKLKRLVWKRIHRFRKIISHYRQFKSPKKIWNSRSHKISYGIPSFRERLSTKEDERLTTSVRGVRQFLQDRFLMVKKKRFVTKDYADMSFLRKFILPSLSSSNLGFRDFFYSDKDMFSLIKNYFFFWDLRIRRPWSAEWLWYKKRVAKSMKGLALKNFRSLKTSARLDSHNPKTIESFDLFSVKHRKLKPKKKFSYMSKIKLFLHRSGFIRHIFNSFNRNGKQLFFKKFAQIRDRATLRNKNNLTKRFYFPYKHSRWYYSNFYASYPFKFFNALFYDYNFLQYDKLRSLSYLLLVRKIEFDIFCIKRNVLTDALLYDYPFACANLFIDDYEQVIFSVSKFSYFKLKLIDFYLIFFQTFKKFFFIFEKFNYTNAHYTQVNFLDLFFYESFKFVAWFLNIFVGYELNLLTNFNLFNVVNIDYLKTYSFLRYLSLMSFSFFFVFVFYPIWLILFKIAFLGYYKASESGRFWSTDNFASKFVYMRDSVLERKQGRSEKLWKIGRVRPQLKRFFFDNFLHNTYRLEKLLYTINKYYDYSSKNYPIKFSKNYHIMIISTMLNNWKEQGPSFVMYATKLYVEFLFIIFSSAFFYVVFF